MVDTKDLEEKIAELENNWKRALADYKNLQRRTEEERLAVVEFANSILIVRLLSVLDGLEMLMAHVEDAGLKLTVKEFRQILEDEGLVEIKIEKGDGFDHETMEAIEKLDDLGRHVTQVLRKGYKLKDRIIRPARVKVGEEE